MLKVLKDLPIIMIVISIIFLAVPLDFSEAALAETLPITIGSILFIVIGEIVIFTLNKNNKRNEVTKNENVNVHTER